MAAAQVNLGVMYSLGNGVAKNYIQAHMLANIASANGAKNGVD